MSRYLLYFYKFFFNILYPLQYTLGLPSGVLLYLPQLHQTHNYSVCTRVLNLIVWLPSVPQQSTYPKSKHLLIVDSSNTIICNLALFSPSCRYNLSSACLLSGPARLLSSHVSLCLICLFLQPFLLSNFASFPTHVLHIFFLRSVPSFLSLSFLWRTLLPTLLLLPIPHAFSPLCFLPYLKHTFPPSPCPPSLPSLNSSQFLPSLPFPQNLSCPLSSRVSFTNPSLPCPCFPISHLSLPLFSPPTHPHSKHHPAATVFLPAL